MQNPEISTTFRFSRRPIIWGIVFCGLGVLLAAGFASLGPAIVEAQPAGRRIPLILAITTHELGQAVLFGMVVLFLVGIGMCVYVLRCAPDLIEIDDAQVKTSRDGVELRRFVWDDLREVERKRGVVTLRSRSGAKAMEIPLASLPKDAVEQLGRMLRAQGADIGL